MAWNDDNMSHVKTRATLRSDYLGHEARTDASHMVNVWPRLSV